MVLESTGESTTSKVPSHISPLLSNPSKDGNESSSFPSAIHLFPLSSSIPTTRRRLERSFRIDTSSCAKPRAKKDKRLSSPCESVLRTHRES